MFAVRIPLLAALAALGASAVTAPTQAASPYAPTALSVARLAKSEAILGGQPSALTAILAAQSGREVPQASPALLRPAAYVTPVRREVVREQARLSTAALSGRPDVFGSVALRVRRTPLDKRWHRAAAAPIVGKAGAVARGLRDDAAVEQLDAVNRYVNANVAFIDDIRQFGTSDVWLTASETLRRGRGDCEDYAIAKLQMLRAAGFSDRDLYLVIVKDLVRRADHAVLVARADNRLYVLDNGTDALLDSDEISDYRPVMTFASAGTWIHGYRRPVPQIEMAAATLEPLAPAAAR